MRQTKILLVDDRPENILALEELISAPDVELLSATSGNDALALLLDHEFALALLDVQMPVMNGFELARLMRSAERSKSIPIIFVTAARIDREVIFEGYGKGAVDFMLKPLDAHIVRSKVRVFVELDQKTRVLREQLAEVAALRDAAEQASMAKSRFLANMSHEIRTPLGAVLGFAELLQLPSQSAADRDNCVSAVLRNGQLLLRLVDDILDLSKIEAERIETERVPLALPELLADLRVVHAHRAVEKGVAFEIIADGALPLTVESDPVRLRQILNNVIGNAIKFTPHGKVTVTVALARREPPELRFTVADTGVGLTVDQQERLFQPFMQADSSTARMHGGTGLGLVIARRLALLLGGDVKLTSSAPGAGSCFSVTVHAGQAALASLRDGASIVRPKPASCWREGTELRLDGIKVLVVDDAADNQMLISRLLRLAGATVEVACNGSDAIGRAMSGEFDVVLMDIQMPGVDGYQATASLRGQGYKRPIIALTAHAMKEEHDRCLRVGFDRHLSKPVRRGELLASVVHFTQKERRPEQVAPADVH